MAGLKGKVSTKESPKREPVWQNAQVTIVLHGHKNPIVRTVDEFIFNSCFEIMIECILVDIVRWKLYLNTYAN